MLLAVLPSGCTKEPSAEALPLADLVIHDVVPVRVVNIPASGGVAMLCKRSIDDPVLAHAMIFSREGTLLSRMDFGSLPNTVENIDFTEEARSITDLVPLADGTFFLIGHGRQTELEQRLHLLVYHVDATGNSIVAPVRRYVTDKSILVRADDVNELYRTNALGALRTEDQLVVSIRFDRQEGALVAAYHRTFQISLSGGAGNFGGPSISLGDPSHQLRHVLGDGSGGTYSLFDTLNATGLGDLIVRHTAWSGNAMAGTQTALLSLRDPEPSSVFVQGTDLVIAGNYQVEADVRRPFFTRAASLSDLQAGTVFPDIGGDDRSATIGALVPNVDGFTAVCNVYEQRVLSVRALRDDRFCDLATLSLAMDGSVLRSRDVIIGRGLRALGAWNESAEWIIGCFHPYLNTDYMHGFVVRTTPP
jgi:hypothetical protein